MATSDQQADYAAARGLFDDFMADARTRGWDPLEMVMVVLLYLAMRIDRTAP